MKRSPFFQLVWGSVPKGSRGRAATFLLGALGLCAAVVAVADDVGASHYWSGTMSWKDVSGTGTAYELDALISIDTKWFGSPIPLCVMAGGLNTCDLPHRPLMCDTPLTNYLVVDQPRGSGYTSYAYGPNGLNNLGRLRVDDVEVPFSFLIIDQDFAHCRVIGRLTTYGTPAPLVVTSPSPGEAFTVSWHIDARDTIADGHVNNQNVRAAMFLNINPNVSNQAPVIDFAGSYSPPVLSEAGYGNLHCRQDSICKFKVKATDPDNDALSFRLATSDEATGGNSLPPPNPGGWPPPPVTTKFQHPGPNCSGCATGPYSVDASTGIGTWDTQGASVGEVYSTQIIVSDGKTQVPIDFMIEIIDPPEPCWDGSSPVVDWETGFIECPLPPPVDCPPGAFRKDPGNPYSACIFPPEEEFIPTPGSPVAPRPWWMPAPPAAAPAQMARSSLLDGHSHRHDRVHAAIAELDQDDDGLRDRDDLCVGDALSLDNDLDGDGLGDTCDPDMDNDGLPNEVDPCKTDKHNLCLAKANALDVTSLGETGGGNLEAAASPLEGRGDAETVPVASVAEARSPAGHIMLAVLGGALLLLLLAMATRRRD